MVSLIVEFVSRGSRTSRFYAEFCLKTVGRRYSEKTVFLKISQNLDEKHLSKVSFQYSWPTTLLKRDSKAGVFL